MGICPDHYKPGKDACKKDVLDLTFEDSIINIIEQAQACR